MFTFSSMILQEKYLRDVFCFNVKNTSSGLPVLIYKGFTGVYVCVCVWCLSSKNASCLVGQVKQMPKKML